MPIPASRRPLIGAHMSISGGVDQALMRGQRLGCDTIQIFVKSNVQWKMLPLGRGEVKRFAAAKEASEIWPVFAHSSYLINLASSDRSVLAKSIRSLAEEMGRVADLGLPFIVLHPGSHGGRGIREGIAKASDGLDKVLAQFPRSRVKILLETTAGQGNSIGWRFEQIAEIIARVDRPERLGVCFDTCHVFAAGYDTRAHETYRRVMDEFDAVIGIRKIQAFHLNDSKGALGSHLDRHAHIGKGALGLGAFALLLRDPRFAGLPMVLETPKGEGTALDRRNLKTLRSLLKQ
ncbi:MAG: deoxyribonuclease IV [Candidatus Aureabacteria bacterium]|nr:deoxyribonuclease IV [Candidatus Auribacterota bacterium]